MSIADSYQVKPSYNKNNADKAYYIPAIGGKVKVSVEDEKGEPKEIEISVVPDVLIKDAVEAGNGERAHQLIGQEFAYYATHLFRECHTEEVVTQWNLTVKFLVQIQNFIKSTRKSGYVKTIFGLKYIEFKKEAKRRPRMNPAFAAMIHE
jgi:hypothetical protein